MYLQRELENRGAKINSLSTCKQKDINEKNKDLKDINVEILNNIISTQSNDP